MPAEMGSPSTSTCFSYRCQPRGRTSSVAISSFSAYDLPSGDSNEMERLTASRRLIWPRMVLCHVGVFESSKSDMNILAPELRALMTILRSTGPVISTRRSCRSAGTGATCHDASSRMCLVSGRKSGRSPASKASWRTTRAASSSARRARNSRCRPATNATASGVRISAISGETTSRISTPSGSC